MTYGYGISILCIWRMVGLGTPFVAHAMIVRLSGIIIAVAMIILFVSFIGNSTILRFCFSRVAHALVFVPCVLTMVAKHSSGQYRVDAEIVTHVLAPMDRPIGHEHVQGVCTLSQQSLHLHMDNMYPLPRNEDGSEVNGHRFHCIQNTNTRPCLTSFLLAHHVTQETVLMPWSYILPFLCETVDPVT